MPALTDEPAAHAARSSRLPCRSVARPGKSHDVPHDHRRSMGRSCHRSGHRHVVDACRFVPPGVRRCLYIGMIDLSDPTSTTTQPEVRQLAGDRLLVSVVEAAAMLSLSRSSIYQLIWTEQLTPIHIGRSVRLSTGQLEQFVADRLNDSHIGR